MSQKNDIKGGMSRREFFESTRFDVCGFVPKTEPKGATNCSEK